MNHRVVAATAGGIGLAAVITAAALSYVSSPSPNTFAAAMISRPARVLEPPRLRQAEEIIEPSVLTIPTITIYGELPRRGLAEFQRPDKRATAGSIVALP